MEKQVKKLYRSKSDRIISGICGGMGEYFDMDPVIFRILFVLLALSGVGILLYIILIFVIPLEGKEEALNKDNLKEHIKDTAEDIKKDAQDLAQKIKMDENWVSGRRNRFAIIVILIGALALVHQIIPIPWLGFNIIWPVVIILIGVMIISRN
jgi:phage shock protein C